MPYVKDVDGNIQVDLPSFDRSLRYLMVADLQRGEDDIPGGTFNMPGALVGLPGGQYVENEEQFFKQYELKVKGEAIPFHPPPVHGDNGEPIPLEVDIRARKVSDFTGAELRQRESAEGEINELQHLNETLTMLLKHIKKDVSKKAQPSKQKDVRQGIAKILRGMSDAMMKEGE